ncbi:hypothetical protein OH77DRAFT_803593 [Trametes cingulata]|nr:hypothetical protein OH77DRAFT_803593 [Trametes cingulata]
MWRLQWHLRIRRVTPSKTSCCYLAALLDPGSGVSVTQPRGPSLKAHAKPIGRSTKGLEVTISIPAKSIQTTAVCKIIGQPLGLTRRAQFAQKTQNARRAQTGIQRTSSVLPQWLRGRRIAYICCYVLYCPSCTLF